MSQHVTPGSEVQTNFDAPRQLCLEIQRKEATTRSGATGANRVPLRPETRKGASFKMPPCLRVWIRCWHVPTWTGCHHVGVQCLIWTVLQFPATKTVCGLGYQHGTPWQQNKGQVSEGKQNTAAKRVHDSKVAKHWQLTHKRNSNARWFHALSVKVR